MKFAGIADRIDALDDGTLRVVDYKTGAPHLEFAGVESLFRGEGKQRLSNILQTLLYAMMLYRTRGVDAEPALYYVRAMNRPDYLPTLDDRETGVRGGRYTLYANGSRSWCAKRWRSSTIPRRRSASAKMPTPASSAIST